MKAFILAAGKGERLRPLTDAVPKCLMSIQSVPVLAVWLELCRLHHIDEILVNTHSHADLVKSYIRDHSDGLSVHIREEEILLGSAGTLLANRSWIGSERDFWIFYGDVLTNTNMTRMLEFHRRRDQIATIGVYEVSNPKQCGIVTVDQEHVVREFIEKPANPSSDLAFSGILVATPAIFDVIPRRVPADIGFHVLPKLVGRMAAYPISEYLVDIGTPASYLYAQLTWPGLLLPHRRNLPC
jgi:mannose-1-phosphate guanylyltransferase